MKSSTLSPPVNTFGFEEGLEAYAAKFDAKTDFRRHYINAYHAAIAHALRLSIHD